jgi:hypothetical protein
MGSVNNPNPALDATVRLFDSFYQYNVTVPQNDYDVVYSFFKSVFVTEQAAGSFTVTLFRISDESGISVYDLLDDLEKRPVMEITATLAYYLNGIRSPSTLLGYRAPATPNFYAARNVRQ